MASYQALHQNEPLPCSCLPATAADREAVVGESSTMSMAAAAAVTAAVAVAAVVGLSQIGRAFRVRVALAVVAAQQRRREARRTGGEMVDNPPSAATGTARTWADATAGKDKTVAWAAGRGAPIERRCGCSPDRILLCPAAHGDSRRAPSFCPSCRWSLRLPCSYSLDHSLDHSLDQHWNRVEHWRRMNSC